MTSFNIKIIVSAVIVKTMIIILVLATNMGQGYDHQGRNNQMIIFNEHDLGCSFNSYTIGWDISFMVANSQSLNL